MTVPSDETLLRRIADRTTEWRFHCWYWGDAIAIDGLLEAHTLGIGEYRGHVVETLLRWHLHCLPNFDDVLAPGAAIMRLVMDGDLPAAAADRLLGQLTGLPCAVGSVPALEPHRHFERFGVCIDAVYHLPATFALAARLKGDRTLAARGVEIASDCMRVLRCKGGWAQWFDPVRRCNNAVPWSRGLGWAVLGMLDLVDLLDGEAPDAVLELAGQVLERLALTQEPDGNWAAVLDHAAGGFETSTAAFYVAAALHPASAGFAAFPSPVLERAAASCRHALGADGAYTGVSADVLPRWGLESYEHRPTEPSPWAQGAGLRAFAGLVRANRPPSP